MLLFLFDRFSKVVVQLLTDLENRYSAVSSMLNATEIYSRISSSVTSLVRFEDVFDLTDLSEQLEEIGVDSNTIRLIRQSFVNVNRVRCSLRSCVPLTLLVVIDLNESG
jgi:hypothetical protein